MTENTFRLKYLGFPIIASRLTKTECRSLANKIITRVQTWSTRSISFAGRVRLINSVIFGMFSYWASRPSIFLLPKEVTSKLIHKLLLQWNSRSQKDPPHFLGIGLQAKSTRRAGDKGFHSMEQCNNSEVGLGHHKEEGSALGKMDSLQIHQKEKLVGLQSKTPDAVFTILTKRKAHTPILYMQLCRRSLEGAKGMVAKHIWTLASKERENLLITAHLISTDNTAYKGASSKQNATHEYKLQ
ncbi:LOW QUALITY PROTEIN: hypothetical protein Cgig2_018731 [Carnegiea gigantea]|uniref:Uncharacterized protein n=1 Tax=Carnegiea gigantea TaxID=171969 RepID=A0A9Q1GL80_9CARY|nr:LOW QUALITY PROTEIN: hypothetical protein Cgig2_018731 [Carnegiea gigantea]